MSRRLSCSTWHHHWLVTARVPYRLLFHISGTPQWRGPFYRAKLLRQRPGRCSYRPYRGATGAIAFTFSIFILRAFLIILKTASILYMFTAKALLCKPLLRMVAIIL